MLLAPDSVLLSRVGQITSSSWRSFFLPGLRNSLCSIVYVYVGPGLHPACWGRVVPLMLSPDLTETKPTD